jgi:hypothetical protein
MADLRQAAVLLFSDLRKDGLIASRPITADGTHCADGTDVFSPLVLSLIILVPVRPCRAS